MDLITSRENPKIKRIVKLLSPKGGRLGENLFVAEGARLCGDAVKSGIAVHEAFFTGKALEKYPEARALMDKADESHIVSDGVADKISATSSPQGVFAVCERPRLPCPEFHAENARYLLLSKLQDPGNVGSIIRTAEAFGIDGVCVSADCPDIMSPKVLRASMGGVFRLKIWNAADMPAEIGRLKSEGVNTFAAVLDDTSEKLGEFQFKGPCAVLLGNEGAGLPDDIVSECDFSVMIPMAGRADSLGVAAAAGIFVWEMTK